MRICEDYLTYRNRVIDINFFNTEKEIMDFYKAFDQEAMGIVHYFLINGFTKIGYKSINKLLFKKEIDKLDVLKRTDEKQFLFDTQDTNFILDFNKSIFFNIRDSLHIVDCFYLDNTNIINIRKKEFFILEFITRLNDLTHSKYIINFNTLEYNKLVDCLIIWLLDIIGNLPPYLNKKKAVDNIEYYYRLYELIYNKSTFSPIFIKKINSINSLIYEFNTYKNTFKSTYGEQSFIYEIFNRLLPIYKEV